MPYFAKSVFLIVSYFVLMSEIADWKAFFLSLLIFVGSILFDLYFSFQSLSYIGETLAVTVTRIIIYVLAVVAILGVAVSILGFSDVLCVIQIDGIRYITFVDAEFQTLRLEFGKFLMILFIEIVSWLPDFLINKMQLKAETKKKDGKRGEK